MRYKIRCPTCEKHLEVVGDNLYEGRFESHMSLKPLENHIKYLHKKIRRLENE